MNMRAKFSVQSVKRTQNGEELKMSPVTSKPYDPATGISEDNTFAKYSPSGEFTLFVTNPALHGQFNPGDAYYLDFTKAE